MFTVPSRLVSTNFGIWSYHCSLSNFAPISLRMFKCSWAHTVSCLFMYCSFAHVGHVDVMFSTVSSNCLEILHLLSVSVCNTFVPCYLFCNARSRAAITALSVSTSLWQPQKHVFSANKLSIHTANILAMHYFVSHFFFKESPNLSVTCWMRSFFVSHFSFDWFNFSATFGAVLIVQFMFGWVTSWLLKIFTNWSSSYFVFRYPAILIICSL